MSDPAEESSRAKAHYEGHRDRLRARLIEKGTETLADYELLELLLFTAIPRRDVKPLAKKLIADHKDFYGVLTASHAQLTASGLSDNTACFLCAVGAAGLRSRKKTIINQPILSSWQRVVDYCRHAMAHEAKEQFRLLFLDRRNRLIAEEVQQRGTIDHTPVYPREIVQRALEVGAGALVLVHNHPSGDVTPSNADIDITRAIEAACKPLGILVHDHLIVGQDDVASFKALGLL